MEEDYWRSRRHRFSAAEAFSIAMHSIYYTNLASAMVALKEAASLDHPTALAVLAMLQNIPSVTNLEVVRKAIDAQTLIYPWVVGYRHRDAAKFGKYMPALKIAAETGDAASQYLYGAYLFEAQQDTTELLGWYHKAAAQGFADAFERISQTCRLPNGDIDPIGSLRLQLKAATLGSLKATRFIASQMDRHLPAAWIAANITAVELAIFFAKDKLFSRGSSAAPFFKFITDAYDGAQCTNPAFANTCLDTLFIVGREFNDYERCYLRLDDESHALVQPLVRLYLKISARVRQIALQSIIILRDNRRINRDIAVMIAKIVYASRLDVAAWYTLDD